MKVWAFNKPDTPEQTKLLYESVNDGKSRFGWSWRDEHDLTRENNWTDEHSKQLFLLNIKKGDWIVHINLPEWGKCVAAQVIGEYSFDDGIIFEKDECDFRHVFEIDTESIVEFERNHPVIDPRVNLKPRGRYHRVYAVEEFQKSIEDIRNGNGREITANREQYHLWERTNAFLERIAPIIHETHQGKKLECFLADVFRQIPGVEVQENGSGWGTDHGADLILTRKVTVGESIDFDYKIVVQVKSYKGEVFDTQAVDQIETAFKEYQPDAGMIITTGERTEILENAVDDVSNKLGRPVTLLAGSEVAEFVIKNAADLIFPFRNQSRFN